MTYLRVNDVFEVVDLFPEVARIQVQLTLFLRPTECSEVGVEHAHDVLRLVVDHRVALFVPQHWDRELAPVVCG